MYRHLHDTRRLGPLSNDGIQTSSILMHLATVWMMVLVLGGVDGASMANSLDEVELDSL